jgi:dGTPase
MSATTPRAQTEQREELALSPHAARSGRHRGRERVEPECPVRAAFQHDCHRIVHSKAFRRLKGKTQVFLWPHGDHYRTRLTHCQEVSQIARTLARTLALNEDLAEAIALGHDLGHTPFGHAGEESLQRLVPGGFRHERQSLRVVERLENDGKGLNLTLDVRDGIIKHSKGAGPLLAVPASGLPLTLEGQLVRLADVIAYVNHDLDDALRARVLDPGDLPRSVVEVLGDSHSARVTRLVLDVLESSQLGDTPRIGMSDERVAALEELRAYLNDNLYYNTQVHAEFRKAQGILEQLWAHCIADLDRFFTEIWPGALRDGPPEADVRDFLAGMTDAFAVNLFERIFTPRRWWVL